VSWQLLGEPANWFIYTLLCPVTGVVRYVGFSANVVKRFKRHLKNGRLMERDYPVNRWIHDLLRRGLEPECVIVESGSGAWGHAEAQWISHFKGTGANLLNVCEGGFFTVPAEARKRAGETMRGRTISEEQKLLISKANKGRKRPDAIEMGKRMAENNRGKKRVMTEDVLRACRENGLKAKGNLLHWSSMTDDQKEQRRAKIRATVAARNAAKQLGASQ
jgi:hypothetical protein